MNGPCDPYQTQEERDWENRPAPIWTPSAADQSLCQGAFVDESNRLATIFPTDGQRTPNFANGFHRGLAIGRQRDAYPSIEVDGQVYGPAQIRLLREERDAMRHDHARLDRLEATLRRSLGGDTPERHIACDVHMGASIRDAIDLHLPKE